MFFTVTSSVSLTLLSPGPLTSQLVSTSHKHASLKVNFSCSNSSLPKTINDTEDREAARMGKRQEREREEGGGRGGKQWE